MKKHSTKDFLAGILFAALTLALVSPAGAALVGKTIEVFTGVTIYVDGVEMKPTDANGKPVDTFIYEGTTYVPLRAVSQSLGYNVQWDGSTQSVYIGNQPGGTQYLLDVCPAYTSKGYATPERFAMGGKYYTHGFSLDGYSSLATFNLDGQYTTLEFDFGHIDGEQLQSAEYSVYLDGELFQVLSAGASDLPQHITLPVDGVLQLKIEATGYHGINHPDYGFANAILH